VAGITYRRDCPTMRLNLRALFDCEAFRALSGAQKWIALALGDGGPPS